MGALDQALSRVWPQTKSKRARSGPFSCNGNKTERNPGRLKPWQGQSNQLLSRYLRSTGIFWEHRFHFSVLREKSTRTDE
jgi:hypothetical protein